MFRWEYMTVKTERCNGSDYKGRLPGRIWIRRPDEDETLVGKEGATGDWYWHDIEETLLWWLNDLGDEGWEAFNVEVQNAVVIDHDETVTREKNSKGRSYTAILDKREAYWVRKTFWFKRCIED